MLPRVSFSSVAVKYSAFNPRIEEGLNFPTSIDGIKINQTLGLPSVSAEVIDKNDEYILLSSNDYNDSAIVGALEDCGISSQNFKVVEGEVLDTEG